MAWLNDLIARIKGLLGRPEVVAVNEQEQARLIGRLEASDAGIRVSAARALAAFPTPAAGEALATAVKDRDVRVREAAAHSIQAIGKQAKVPITPVMDALQLEPADSDALYPLVGALRTLGPGVAAERVVAEKKGWGIARASQSKIEEMVSLREKLAEFSSDAVAMEVAFDELFQRLDDPDPDIRGDVRATLAGNRYSVRPLWAIYNELLETEPRKAVIAGRVMGYRLNPRGIARVPASTTMTKLGVPIAYVTAPCAYCGHENPNIPVTEKARTLPYQSRRAPEGWAYHLNVLCDFCGNDFYVVWEEDPRPMV